MRGWSLFLTRYAAAQVYNVAQLPKRLLFASGAPEDTLFVDASQGSITWLPDVVTRGDVMIKVCVCVCVCVGVFMHCQWDECGPDGRTRQCKHYGKKKKETIFKATFHTAFVETIEKLEVKDLDAIIKPKKRFRPDQYPDDFAVVIYLEKGVGESGFGESLREDDVLCACACRIDAPRRRRAAHAHTAPLTVRTDDG